MIPYSHLMQNIISNHIIDCNNYMRKVDKFKCKKCNKIEETDIHAATMFSSFLMLKTTVSTK